MFINSSFGGYIFQTLYNKYVLSLHYCYGLNDYVSPNSCAGALTYKVIVLGSGNFGKELGLDEVPGVLELGGTSAYELTVRGMYS